MTNWGERLRQLRHEKGLSLADIENRRGVFKCYVSRVELGFIVPQLAMLRKWGKALRVPIFEIFPPDGSISQHGLLARLNGGDERSYKRLSRVSERGRRLFPDTAKKMPKPGGRNG
jgi:transcriptional regulator with XRE-family HTH domain